MIARKEKLELISRKARPGKGMIAVLRGAEIAMTGMEAMKMAAKGKGMKRTAMMEMLKSRTLEARGLAEIAAGQKMMEMPVMATAMMKMATEMEMMKPTEMAMRAADLAIAAAESEAVVGRVLEAALGRGAGEPLVLPRRLTERLAGSEQEREMRLLRTLMMRAPGESWQLLVTQGARQMVGE